MSRPRTWNYRRISLSDGASDGSAQVEGREGCAMFGYGQHEPSRFCWQKSFQGGRQWQSGEKENH
jgi:hypothetical protein